MVGKKPAPIAQARPLIPQERLIHTRPMHIAPQQGPARGTIVTQNLEEGTESDREAEPGHDEAGKLRSDFCREFPSPNG